LLKTIVKNIPWASGLAYRFLFWLRENNLVVKGRDNKIESQGARLENNSINITGSNNFLCFEPGSSVRDCHIEVHGDHHRLWIGAGVILTQSTIWFEDHHCQISIGEKTTMQRFGHIAVTEPNRKIEIGPECMFSFDVDIRNGDSHSILNLETGKRVNWAKDIQIGRHVWLGAKTEILGGAEIGENAIIGIGSMVNGKIEANCIAVGTPAKVVKSGFTWAGERLTEGDPYPS